MTNEYAGSQEHAAWLSHTRGGEWFYTAATDEWISSYGGRVPYIDVIRRFPAWPRKPSLREPARPKSRPPANGSKLSGFSSR